jgi:hypothetical protein
MFLCGDEYEPRGEWLYERLRFEPIRQDECARWNSIISRLRARQEIVESACSFRTGRGFPGVLDWPILAR